MSTNITCTACSQQLQIPPNFAGNSASCPNCKSVVNVPAAPPAVQTSAPVIETQKKKSTAASKFRSRKYPMITLARKMYNFLGWLGVVGGVIGFALCLIGGVLAFTASQSTGSGLMAGGIVLSQGIALALYSALMVVTFWTISQILKLMTDVQDNSHRTSFYTQQLVQHQQGLE